MDRAFRTGHQPPGPAGDPVLCGCCGSLFGAGADRDAVCPWCAGGLFPVPAIRELVGPGLTGGDEDGAA